LSLKVSLPAPPVNWTDFTWLAVKLQVCLVPTSWTTIFELEESTSTLVAELSDVIAITPAFSVTLLTAGWMRGSNASTLSWVRRGRSESRREAKIRRMRARRDDVMNVPGVEERGRKSSGAYRRST